MKQTIDAIRKTRHYLLELVKDLTPAQLNEIPAGFSNNIIWNMGHLVAAEQGICYRRSGMMHLPDERFWLTYKPGSRPEADASDEEIALVKGLLITSLDQLEVDYKAGLFTNYTPWVTRYDVPINNVDDGIGFVLYHEGLHTGVITALKKMVTSQAPA